MVADIGFKQNCVPFAEGLAGLAGQRDFDDPFGDEQVLERTGSMAFRGLGMGRADPEFIEFNLALFVEREQRPRTEFSVAGAKNLGFVLAENDGSRGPRGRDQSRERDFQRVGDFPQHADAGNAFRRFDLAEHGAADA